MSNEVGSNRGTVIWLEDEPDLLLAEMYDLRSMKFSIKSFSVLGEAYDWMSENQSQVQSASAILVDVTMPHRDDRRFDRRDGTPGGAVFCERMKDFPYWNLVRERILLYTRLPLGETYYLVNKFAKAENLKLVRKASGSRIAEDLISTGIIRADD